MRASVPMIRDIIVHCPAPRRGPSLTNKRRLRWAGVACMAFAAALTAAAQGQDKTSKDKDSDKDKDKRPKLTLTARPPIGMSPAKIAITAELNGGRNDLEDFYCTTTEWDWGDGTESETTADCEPYEPGKSTFKRRFTVEHIFRPGRFRVTLRLKKHDKAVSQATVTVEVRPGIRDL
jgi:hypothetical protein